MNMSPEKCNRGIQFVTLCLLLALGSASALAEEGGQGYKLYVHYQCHQCHGFEGQGGTPGGPRITSLDYPFETFVVRTRHTNIMPAYSPNVLSDDDLKTIYEFVSSMPDPPPVETFPLLRDALEDTE